MKVIIVLIKFNWNELKREFPRSLGIKEYELTPTKLWVC